MYRTIEYYAWQSLRGGATIHLTYKQIFFFQEVIHMAGIKFNPVKVGIFAAGVAFGTAGIRLLTSKDAKKAYTHATAAVLRAKDEVVKTTTILQENCSDILEEAKQINEDRLAAEECFDDELKAAAKELNEAAKETAE